MKPSGDPVSHSPQVDERPSSSLLVAGMRKDVQAIISEVSECHILTSNLFVRCKNEHLYLYALLDKHCVDILTRVPV